jgi:hypothetical protein
VSLILLAIAALSVNQVRQEARHDSGLNLEHLALVQVDFGLQRYEPERVRQIVGPSSSRLRVSRTLRPSPLRRDCRWVCSPRVNH